MCAKARSALKKPGRLLSAGLAFFAVLGAAAPAAAGSITITVREADGPSLREIVVVLSRAEGPTRPYFPSWVRQVTDGRGRATFRDLAPGSYAVSFPALPSPLVSPRAHPYAASPAVTLLADEDLTLEVALARGIPVEVTATFNGEPAGAGRVVFRHRASGLELASRFRETAGRPAAKRFLTPGVWDVTVDAPPGWLLIGVDRDDTPLPGFRAAVDLALDPFPTYLTWHFAAPCEISGHVSATGGEPQYVDVEAVLVEGGAWVEAARERGGSKVARVPADVSKKGRYGMILPDGVWRLAPVGERLAASEPPFVDLRLAPGEAGRADFHVTLDAEDGAEGLLMVRTGAADRSASQRFPGVRVEVFPGGSDEVAATADGGSSGIARIRGLVRGDYRVVATHPDYLEGHTEVHDYVPDPQKPRWVFVELPAGAAVRLEATDPGGEPVSGVVLEVERLDDRPEILSRDPTFLAAKRRRRAVTDLSGRARVRGFYSGAYLVRAALRGGRGRSAALIDLTLKDAPETRLGPEVEVALSAGQELALAARPRPAADLRMTLVCSDGQALPEAVSASLYDVATWDDEAFAPPAAEQEEPPEKPRTKPEPVLQLQDVPLGGRLGDVLTVGPLPQGVYRMALDPVGFERTTWAFETYDPRAAHEIQLDLDESRGLETVDLGLVHLECGPAVDVVPEVASGDALPKLEDVGLEVRLFDREQEREVDARLMVTARERRFEVRNLPRGPLRVDFVLSHPHLLPAPALRWQADVDLERGAFIELTPLLEAIGGAVRVKGEGAVARISGAGGEREAVVDGGQARFPSLKPGTYDVRLCGDAECDRPMRRWDAVEVKAGHTVTLASDDL